MLFRKIESYLYDYFKLNSNKILLIEGAHQIVKKLYHKKSRQEFISELY